MKQELKTIHCYDAVSFVIEVEKAVKEGFSLDLVTPQNYPQQIGFNFITTMVKEVETVEQEEQPVKGVVKPVEDLTAQQEGVDSQEVVREVVEAPKKAGRPAKAK